MNTWERSYIQALISQLLKLCIQLWWSCMSSYNFLRSSNGWSFIYIWSYLHLHLSLHTMKIKTSSNTGAIWALVLVNELLLVNLHSYSFFKINNDSYVTSYSLWSPYHAMSLDTLFHKTLILSLVHDALHPLVSPSHLWSWFSCAASKTHL